MVKAFSSPNSFFVHNFLPFSQSIEIDEMFTRIKQTQGVIAVMIFNTDGVATKTSLDGTQTNLWAAVVIDMAKKAKAVGSTIGNGNKLVMIRIRTSKNEVMITNEKTYILVSIHAQVNENEA